MIGNDNNTKSRICCYIRRGCEELKESTFNRMSYARRMSRRMRILFTTMKYQWLVTCVDVGVVIVVVVVVVVASSPASRRQVATTVTRLPNSARPPVVTTRFRTLSRQSPFQYFSFMRAHNLYSRPTQLTSYRCLTFFFLFFFSVSCKLNSCL